MQLSNKLSGSSQLQRPPWHHSVPGSAFMHSPCKRGASLTLTALPDPSSFSGLDTSSLMQMAGGAGEQVRAAVEALWPGVEHVNTAAMLQPTLDTLQAATSAVGSGLGFDPAITADLSSSLLEGAHPHMGSEAAMAAVDALSSWASSMLGSTADPAAGSELGGLSADVQSTLGRIRDSVGALSGAGAATGSSTEPALSAVASTLTAVTASLGSLLDGSMPPVDTGKLLAGLAAAMDNAGGGHPAVVRNPMVAAVSGAALLVIMAVGEATEAQRGLWEDADEGSREQAQAMMKVERAAQARSILLKDGCYCPDRLSGYFENRPVLVARRAAQVALEAAGLGAALAMDFATGSVERNERERAMQMRQVIERLGPAYVKVAQALSTRVDLLSPPYFEQIQMLQDRVPPFPTSISRTVLETSLGKPVDAMFEMLSERPVAAASLGQVYYGVTRKEYGGVEVAVKVQRPGVLEAVALDLLLIRSMAVALKGQNRVDWAGIIDAWALRFFHEMDYSWEARAMNTFAKQMAPLKGIQVTEAVEELCSDEVLTTGWIRGEKLSESRASDVRELCNSLLNAYLVQLLETGFLHADPHPGNLMRSNDGRIVILDFGLMTEVTEEQREALISYIAHLLTEDWYALAYDLQALGFIPKDIDPSDAGLVEPLGRILKQLTGGGGAARVNIDKVVDDLDKLGEQYPFEIPPFFALILRAFSVIEGIALGVDPEYAIVQECFPYLSKRLLNDDSPRTKQLLREVLYGRQGRKRLDIERLMRFADGLSAYTTDALTKQPSGSTPTSTTNGASPSPTPAASTSASSGNRSSSSSPSSPSNPAFGSPESAPSQEGKAPAQASAQPQQQPALDPTLRETLLVVFSRRGSYIQELLVEELVAAADALSREASYNLLRALLASFPLAAAQAALGRLGPARRVLLPLPTPVELMQNLTTVVAVTEEDREALQVVRGIMSLAARAQPPASSSAPSAGGSPSFSPGQRMQPFTSAFGPTSLRGANNGSGGFGPSFIANQRSLARVSEEWSPFLAELIPGVAYTGELFVRAFMSRVASRLSQGLSETNLWQLQPSAVTSSSNAGGSNTGSSNAGSSSSRNGSSMDGSSRYGSSMNGSSSGTTIGSDGTITVDSRTVSSRPTSSRSGNSSSSGLRQSGATPKTGGASSSSKEGSTDALPRGRYPPYSPPGAAATPTGSGNGFGSRFFDVAQWLIGGGARIESKSIAPKKAMKKGGANKAGEANVAVKKK